MYPYNCILNINLVIILTSILDKILTLKQPVEEVRTRRIEVGEPASLLVGHSCVVNLSLYGKPIQSVNNWATFTSLLVRHMSYAVRCFLHSIVAILSKVRRSEQSEDFKCGSTLQQHHDIAKSDHHNRICVPQCK